MSLITNSPWNNGLLGSLISYGHSFNPIVPRLFNNCLSDPLPLKFGVLQGSILGPLLFVTYFNDLSSSITHSNLLKFADDVKRYKSTHNLHDFQYLQLDVDWSLVTKLSFNINKCVVLQCKPSTNTNSDTSYNINNRELSKVAEHRDLGIIFTENLSWYSHYEAIVAKAYKSLGLLKQTLYLSILHHLRSKELCT